MENTINKNVNGIAVTILKCIIAISSIMHLFFSNIHIRALLKLTDEICGFIVFMFVLSGLLLLFESTRIVGTSKNKTLVHILLFSFFQFGLGTKLVSIYLNEFAIRDKMDVVNHSLYMTYAICAADVVIAILAIVAICKKD